MTNAEKYLKDNVSVEEFLDKMVKSSSGFENEEIDVNEFGYCIDTEDIKTFLNKEAKPTLTEEERVILKVLQEFHFNYVLGRKNTTLYGYDKFEEDGERHITNIPSLRMQQLFQFIKERRRI